VTSASNFDFLQPVLTPAVHATLVRAERLHQTAPEWCVVACGVVAERLCRALLQQHDRQGGPPLVTQEERIGRLRTASVISAREAERLNVVRVRRNDAAHGDPMTKSVAVETLRELWAFGCWYVETQCRVTPPTTFRSPADLLVEKTGELAVAHAEQKKLLALLEAEQETAKHRSDELERAQAEHREKQRSLAEELSTLTSQLADFRGTVEERARLEEEQRRMTAEREDWLARVVTLERERRMVKQESGRREREALKAVEQARVDAERLAAERDRLAMDADQLRTDLEHARRDAAEAGELRMHLSELENPDAAYANEYPRDWRDVPSFLRSRLGVCEDGSTGTSRPPFMDYTIPRQVRCSAYAETWSALHRDTMELARVRIAKFDTEHEDAAAEVWRRETEWAGRLRDASDVDAVGLGRVLCVPTVDQRGYCVHSAGAGINLRDWLTAKRPRRLTPALRSGIALARGLARLADLGIACQGFAPEAFVVQKGDAMLLVEPCAPEPEGFAAPEARLDRTGLPPTFSHAEIQRSFVFVVASVTTAMLLPRVSNDWLEGRRPTSVAALMGRRADSERLEIEQELCARLDRLARDEGVVVDIQKLCDALSFGASPHPDDRPATLGDWVRAVGAAAQLPA
jgi:hypothetical protein